MTRLRRNGRKVYRGNANVVVILTMTNRRLHSVVNKLGIAIVYQHISHINFTRPYHSKQLCGGLQQDSN